LRCEIQPHQDREPIMNITITGVTGMRNRGVMALVTSIVEQIALRIPSARFTIITGTPDYDAVHLTHPAAAFVTDYFAADSTSRLNAFAAKCVPKLRRRRQELHRLIRASDLVVVTGGDIFSSDYGRQKTWFSPIDMALDAGVRVAMLAHSIGPYKTTEQANEWLARVRRGVRVSVREALTHRYLTERLGLPASDVFLAADPAFLLATPPPDVTERLRTHYRVDERTVGLAVSQAMGRWAGVDSTAHFEAWVRLIRGMLDVWGARVLLVPHSQNVAPNHDDRLMATGLLRALGFDARLTLAGADHTAGEFKAVLGGCQMVIAERMHAALAGLSSGVCTVPVKYSVKAEGIMTDLFGSQAVERGLVLTMDRLLATDSVERLGQVWSQRAQIAQELRPAVQNAQRLAAAGFDHLLRNLPTN
jgi:colanic acid/amylovoran biosynthesis protein